MDTSQLPKLSDEQLVLAFQRQRDMAVIDVLYRRYYQNVFYYCYKIIGDREDALDASGDIFLKMIENLQFLHHAITFQAWLFRIARNQAASVCCRKQKRRYTRIETISHPAQVDVPLEQHWVKDAQMEKKKAAFRALPIDVKELLQKKYKEGISIESLMGHYKVSKSAIKMRLARGRQKARRQLSGTLV